MKYRAISAADLPRRHEPYPHPELGIDATWKELVAAEPAVMDLWRDIYWHFGISYETCPETLWYGYLDRQRGQKARLGELFGYDSPAFWAAYPYLTSASRTCLHCVRRPLREADLEFELAERLAQRYGKRAVRRQVTCAVGRADLVVNATVYELKLFLTRDTIMRAIGQATAYKAALKAEQIVIGGIVTREVMPLLSSLEEQGIGVIGWKYPLAALDSMRLVEP